MTPIQLAEIRARYDNIDPPRMCQFVCARLYEDSRAYLDHMYKDIPALLDEVERLRTTIQEISKALWCEDNYSAITDTLWFDDACTLKDYIDMSLEGKP